MKSKAGVFIICSLWDCVYMYGRPIGLPVAFPHGLAEELNRRDSVSRTIPSSSRMGLKPSPS